MYALLSTSPSASISLVRHSRALSCPPGGWANLKGMSTAAHDHGNLADMRGEAGAERWKNHRGSHGDGQSEAGCLRQAACTQHHCAPSLLESKANSELGLVRI